jgi:hypothetical protein
MLLCLDSFKDSRKMDLGALAWVERSNKITIEGGKKISVIITELVILKIQEF